MMSPYESLEMDIEDWRMYIVERYMLVAVLAVRPFCSELDEFEC